jgi:fused signal recognition particle receptor
MPSKPYVIMVVGVNGVGKTTTIAKLAHQFKKAGKSVVLGAADTFRAAAIEQLAGLGRQNRCAAYNGSRWDPIPPRLLLIH